MQHLTKNNVLYNHQHAASDPNSQQNPSDRLSEFTEDMLKGMKDGNQNDVVLRDFAKATPQTTYVWNRSRDIQMVQVFSLW